MPRSLDSTMQAALSDGVIYPAILVMLSFSSETSYIWSGIGPLIYDAQTFTGVGSLGNIGIIAEGTTVQADGTTVALSGIDPVLYSICMDDIQLGAPAKIWFALLTEGVIIGAPYLLFSGLVDKPSVSAGPDAITISLALESRMVDLQRASQRRYTSNDQQSNGYPDDTAFVWVERLNDQALIWGS